MKLRHEKVYIFIISLLYITFLTNVAMTATIIADITVGNRPTELDITPDGSKVYVGNSFSQTVSVINTVTNMVTATLPAGSRPTGLEVSPNGSEVWVTNRFDGTVTVIDVLSDMVLTTIPNLGIGLVDDVTFTPDGSKAYIVTDNVSGDLKVAVVDVASRNVMGTIRTDHPQEKIHFSPDGTVGYISQLTNGFPSALSTIIFDPVTDTYDPADIIPDLFFSFTTNNGATAWSFNSFLDASETTSPFPSSVILVDIATKTAIDDIPVIPRPALNQGAISQDGGRLYVANNGSDSVTVIDTVSRNILEVIPLADNPISIVVTPDGNTLYVSRLDTNIVTVVGLEAPVPEPITLNVNQDSFLRGGNKNRNEGANPRLRIQATGNNRAVVDFDLTGIDHSSVAQATLTLTIAENANNWGPNDDRTVDAHPLLMDFAEGNGQNAGVPASVSTRGTGQGLTWNCATDDDISNQQPDCNPEWDGGSFGSATAPSVIHANGLLGPVEWDVTSDVLAGATGWIIKKTNEGQTGKVFYYSREGATELSDPTLAPQLFLEFQ